ncbi:unnamed protein product [Arctogadus glacialis]
MVTTAVAWSTPTRRHRAVRARSGVGGGPLLWLGRPGENAQVKTENVLIWRRTQTQVPKQSVYLRSGEGYLRSGGDHRTLPSIPASCREPGVTWLQAGRTEEGVEEVEEVEGVPEVEGDPGVRYPVGGRRSR